MPLKLIISRGEVETFNFSDKTLLPSVVDRALKGLAENWRSYDLRKNFEHQGNWFTGERWPELGKLYAKIKETEGYPKFHLRPKSAYPMGVWEGTLRKGWSPVVRRSHGWEIFNNVSYAGYFNFGGQELEYEYFDETRTVATKARPMLYFDRPNVVYYKQIVREEVEAILGGKNVK